jgi:hypothetical protein
LRCWQNRLKHGNKLKGRKTDFSIEGEPKENGLEAKLAQWNEDFAGPVKKRTARGKSRRRADPARRKGPSVQQREPNE